MSRDVQAFLVQVAEDVLFLAEGGASVSSFRKLVLHDATAFNISGVEDGRIVNDGHLTIRYSRIVSNSSTSSGGVGAGGGI